mgnify:CR=1 FL=1
MRLKDLREEHNLTQKELGALVGVAQSNINRWENGTVRPSADFVVKLADYFGVSTDYLLGRTDELGAILPSAPSLTQQEQNLLQDFRKLVPEMQSYIIGIVHNLASAV